MEDYTLIHDRSFTNVRSHGRSQAQLGQYDRRAGCCSIITEGHPKESPRKIMIYYNSGGVLEGVRRGNMKLLITKKEGTALYNVRNDVNEAINIAAQHAGIVKQLKTLMEKAGDELERNARTVGTLN